MVGVCWGVASVKARPVSFRHVCSRNAFEFISLLHVLGWTLCEGLCARDFGSRVVPIAGTLEVGFTH